MLKRIIVVVMAIALGLLALQASAQTTEYVRIQGRQLVYRGQPIVLRGTNMGNINALGAYIASAPGDRIGTGNVWDVFIRREDYQRARAMGANHVRFGIDYLWYLRDANGFWQMLDNQVAWAAEAGIWFLPISFGNPSRGGTDSCYEGYNSSCDLWGSATDQQLLINWWVAIAQRYRNQPAFIGIDPVNEPTIPGQYNWNTDHWWRIAERLRDAVRAVHPDLLFFIEAGSDAQFTRLLGANVVYQAHNYSPLVLTHGAQSWTSIQCRTGARYPGTMPDWDGAQVYWDRAALEGRGSARANLREILPINWGAANNVPVYIGEWGSQAACPGWDAYVRDVGEVFNAVGVHYAHFSWCANPGNFDMFACGEYPLRVQNPTTYAIVDALWDAGTPVVILPTSTATRTSVGPSPTATRTALPPTVTPTRTASGTPQATIAATATAQPSNTPSAQGTVEPPPVTGAKQFYRAVNLNGGALSIDGHPWEAEQTANFSVTSGAFRFCNPWNALSPATDNGRAQMIRCVAQHWNQQIAMTGMPAGEYEVTMYIYQDWNNPAPAPIDIRVQGVTVRSGYVMPGAAGAWDKQTFSATVSNGTLTLATSGDVINLSGIEVWYRLPGVVPAPTGLPPTLPPTVVPQPTQAPTLVPSPTTVPPGGTLTFYRAVNLGGDPITIDLRRWAGKTAANLERNTTDLCRQDLTVSPKTTAARAKMLRCFTYGWDARLRFLNVPNGQYQVVIYIFEDTNPEAFTVTLQNGQVILPKVTTGKPGTWQKLGPLTVTVTDATLSVQAYGGNANLSGIELWQVAPAAAAGPVIAPTFAPAK
jgi:hypothetical protein